MRNLKRVLSLALAAIMLLGMMTLGTSAASVSSFPDGDRIVNVEAATVTTGLGIFEGEANTGNFNPTGAVTRAQMATIVVKLLYGADYNADSLRGIKMFDDTASFEGGWAEGYINLCAQLGIVSGYAGTNNFGPGDTVTTAQAALMLMKVLGYYDEANPKDEYGDSWELSAMTKAGYLGLNGGVTLLATQELTRDNVALLVFNTLLAQLVSYQDSLKDYAKANNHNVTVNNGTVDETNTLLYNTFHVYVAEGTVVANGITDEILAGKEDDPGYTTVVFDETIDLDKDGRLDYSDYDFLYDTGLNMIGHKADVYYRMNRGNPEVLVMMDKATLVEVIRYDSDSTTRLANTANALGFRRNTILNIEPADYKVNYDLDVTAGSVSRYKTNNGTGTFSKDLINRDYDGVVTSTGSHTVQKYLIVISNSTNYQVDEIILLDQYLDQINTINSNGEYNLADHTGLGRRTVSTYDASAKDYVIVTPIGLRTGNEARYALEPVTAISANVTKLTGVTGQRTLITASGVDYVESPVYYYDGGVSLNAQDLENVIDYQTIRELGETTLLLDAYGNLIASLGEPDVPQYVYVAQFGSQHIPGGSGTLNTTFGLTADVYYADGTHSILFVDWENSSFAPDSGNTVDGSIDSNTKFQDGLADGTGTTADALNGSITQDSSHDNDEVHYTQDKATWTNGVRTAGAFDFSNGALGVYTYKMSGSMIQLTAIDYEETSQNGRTGGGLSDNAVVKTSAGENAFGSTDQFIAGHSTIVRDGTGANGRNVGTIVEENPGKYLRQTNSTIYFYINGNYPDISVETFDDVNDIKGFTVGTDMTKPWVVQLFSEEVNNNNAYRTVSVALIDNVIDAVADPDLFYYNKGQYTVTVDTEGTGFLLTYYVWDEKGEATTLVYNYSREKDAVDAAEGKPTGYYQNTAHDMTKYTVLQADTMPANWQYAGTAPNDYAYRDTTNTRYVVNATLYYETYLSRVNFFDNVTPIASLVDGNTVIVDTCNSGLESVTDIENAFEDDPECLITISYSYSRKTLQTGVLFITSYTPASSTGTINRPTPTADLVVRERDGKLYVISSKSLTNAQIAIAIRDYLNDETITNVSYDAVTKKATIKFSGNIETYQDVVVGIVSDETEVAAGDMMVSVQDKIDNSKPPYADVTINGNKMTASGGSDYATPAGGGGGEVSKASEDMANFMSALYEAGARVIAFNGDDYTWDANAYHSSTGCHWGTGDVDDGGSTLLNAIITAISSDITGNKTATFTLSVDGMPMEFTMNVADPS